MPGMGLAGLAAVPGGYDTGGLQYQKLQAAQNDNAGLAALGKALQSLYLQPGAGGAPVSPAGSPAGPGGPMLLSPPMPGGGGGMPGATTLPPPASGGSPRQPAPSPGPASAGGGPAPGGGGPVTPQSSGYGVPAGMGITGQALTWEDLAKRIVRANPGASPEVIASAVTKALPLMNAESAQQWKYIQMELQKRNLDLRERTEGFRESGGPAQFSPANQAFRAFIEKNPNATPEQMSEYIRSTRGSNTHQSASSMMAQKWWEEHQDGTAEQFQEWWNAPSTQRAVQREQAAADRQQRSIESREGIAAAGRESREGIAGANRESREGIAAAGRESQERRTQAGIEDRQKRQGIALNAKEQGHANELREVDDEISSAIGDIEDAKSGGPSVTGIGGKVTRAYEWAHGTIVGNQPGDTKASVFETKIRAIQSQVPRLLANVGRISNEERAKIDTIVRGLGTFTDPQVAIDSLKELQKILRARGGQPAGGASGGASGGAARPLDAATIGAMQPNRIYTIRDRASGTVHQWQLDQNGQPVEVGHQ
jgi:hypothetical protein